MKKNEIKYMSIKLKKILFFLFIIALQTISFDVLATDQYAITDKGEKVILKDSGTWSVVDLSATDAKPKQKNKQKDYNEASALQKIPADNSTVTKSKGIFDQMDKQIIIIVVSLIILLVLIIVAIIIYFTLVQPAKKRKKLLRALSILVSEQESQFPEAEKLISEAINAGLKTDDLQEACFARSYIRAKSGNYNGAASDIESADQKDPSVIYLKIWINFKLEEFKCIFDLYEKNEKVMTNMLQSKEIMSIACYAIGKEHWKKREIREAVQYFDRVRSLKKFADKVPESISDYQITLGIIALLDDHGDEAMSHFKEAKLNAEKENRSTFNAELGYMLCRWRSGEQVLIEDELTVLLKGIENMVNSQTQKKQDDLGKMELSEDMLLYRNALLLHAVALLHVWSANHRKNSTLKIEERDELEKRLLKVITIDKIMPDPKLILGLIDYYFFQDVKHEDAIKMLEESNSTIPEIELLLNKEKKLAELEHKKLDFFLAIVKDYVNNNEVPQQLKEALLLKLGGFKRFREREIYIPEGISEYEGVTINGLQSRQNIMRKKMGTILKLISAESVDKANQMQLLLNEISTASRNIKEHAEKLEKNEQELLINSGEFLLKEEETLEEFPKSPSVLIPPKEILSTENVSQREGIKNAKKK